MDNSSFLKFIDLFKANIITKDELVEEYRKCSDKTSTEYNEYTPSSYSSGQSYGYYNTGGYYFNEQPNTIYGFPITTITKKVDRCKYCDGKNKDEYLNCVHCGAPL